MKNWAFGALRQKVFFILNVRQIRVAIMPNEKA
jgi:hypothetical protein